MTSLKLDLDPEVEALLQEIASDPRSKLLRVNRPASVSLFAETRPSVGVATAGLTKAERHLVQTARADAGFLLRSVSVYLISSAPKLKGVVSFQARESREDLKVPRVVSLRQMASDSIASNAAGDCDLVSAIMSASTGEWPSVYECAHAAHILDPTPNSIIYAALAVVDGDPFASSRLLQEIDRWGMNSWVRSVALSNRALSAYRCGDLCASIHQYRVALQANPMNLNALVSSYQLAIVIQEHSLAADLARCIDGNWSAADESFGRMLDLLERRATSCNTMLVTSETARSFEHSVPICDASRAVLNAITQRS